MKAIHSTIFPFDRKRTLIADVVEGYDNLFEVYVASTDRPKVPKASRVGECCVPPEYPNGTISMTPPSILHVDMIDPVSKVSDELHVVYSLIP
jgi:hypothetical protein